MNGYRKGTRKPRGVLSSGEINVGGLKVSPALAVSALLGALYSLFLLGSGLETGLDAFVLSAFSVLSFAAFGYLARSGRLPGLRPFALLVDAFLALSTLMCLWELAAFMGMETGLSGLLRPVSISIIFFLLSVVAVYALLLYENGRRKDILLAIGNKSYLVSGIVGLIICILVSVAALYFLFGGAAMGLEKMAYIIGAAVIFSFLGAAYEETWFRGLLLARLLPLIGEKSAIILQAAIFGIFEATTVYYISSQIIYVPMLFMIGSILGYYWGRMTIKDKSIIGAALIHAGFYMLIGMPMLAGMA
ncbi:putative CAAX amino terminal protease family [Methanocella conradii HZ254]|uniref:CAAX amino terminal protease family n=1 Tax=Methanocella conradii (strain DSM 24694 / JCM 17849 / CGMCC 1.5162 / HZ254) TaxID=1041930 RepID=H8I802_METCZ|nr:CPBP family intramembrane glutamic endopeptidase [Methanocella conradii]AFD00402.1 putative CAAX amino terminal protease family [Methanocella conradii HZ254]